MTLGMGQGGRTGTRTRNIIHALPTLRVEHGHKTREYSDLVLGRL